MAAQADNARFPAAWLGRWSTDDGRRLSIERDGGDLRVRVQLPGDDAAGPAMEAHWLELRTNRWVLRVEVGSPDGMAGLGPTYNLSFEADGRAADAGDALDSIVALPEVGMGMYDDFDDDLGVPWAPPLSPWRADPSSGITS